MKKVKMLVDVAEGAVPFSEAKRFDPKAKIKFAKDSVAQLSDASAEKYVKLQLGVVVE